LVSSRRGIDRAFYCAECGDPRAGEFTWWLAQRL